MRSILSNPGLPKEKIRLIKQSGEVIDDITANVQSDMIFIDDSTLDIEEDDTFERDLPSGKPEQFVVLDRGYFPQSRMLAAHYQVKVRRINRKSSYSVNNYNIENSGKVNIHSVDNSTNITLSANDEQLFSTLMELAKQLDDDKVQNNIGSMKDAVGKPTFAKKYNDFIQSIANHMTIFAPFIPALTQLIVG